jgi:hypothetical protein
VVVDMDHPARYSSSGTQRKLDLRSTRWPKT